MSRSRWQPRNSRRWERVRRQVLDAANWRCAQCGKYGNEVDHIVPMRQGGAAWELDNLQPLCRDCHIEKTRQENGRQPTPAEAAWRKLVREMTCR